MHATSQLKYLLLLSLLLAPPNHVAGKRSSHKKHRKHKSPPSSNRTQRLNARSVAIGGGSLLATATLITSLISGDKASEEAGDTPQQVKRKSPKKPIASPDSEIVPFTPLINDSNRGGRSLEEEEELIKKCIAQNKLLLGLPLQDSSAPKDRQEDSFEGRCKTLSAQCTKPGKDPSANPVEAIKSWWIEGIHLLGYVHTHIEQPLKTLQTSDDDTELKSLNNGLGMILFSLTHLANRLEGQDDSPMGQIDVNSILNNAKALHQSLNDVLGLGPVNTPGELTEVSDDDDSIGL